jgi:hypothetical protein
MQWTPLIHTLVNLSRNSVPIRTYVYSIPFYFCTGFEGVSAEVLVLVDAAAEEVCGESCAAHCCVCIGWLDGRIGFVLRKSFR